MPGIYYNEFNPESAAMIRQFMADGLIPHGDVDTRSITEVSPDDIKHYTQCHFFAGIAGWTFALQLARWPADRPVWTGSAPCQPFSSAGRQQGKTDERHLFPVWLKLISECRPASLYGEQVSNAIAHGWLDDVYSGLELQGYAVGSAILPACSVGSPHKRDRLWFVAHRDDAGQSSSEGEGQTRNDAWRGSQDGGRLMANAAGSGWAQGLQSDAGGQPERARGGGQHVGDTDLQGLEEHGRPDELHQRQGRKGEERPTLDTGFWDGQWVGCPDGKTRYAGLGVPLLAHGVPYRRPILHALGNAIVPQVAAEFIKASM